MTSRKQRAIWGIFYFILIPAPILYLYWNNIFGIIGGFFCLYLNYYIFFKDHSSKLSNSHIVNKLD